MDRRARLAVPGCDWAESRSSLRRHRQRQRRGGHLGALSPSPVCLSACRHHPGRSARLRRIRSQNGAGQLASPGPARGQPRRDNTCRHLTGRVRGLPDRDHIARGARFDPNASAASGDDRSALPGPARSGVRAGYHGGPCAHARRADRSGRRADARHMRFMVSPACKRFADGSSGLHLRGHHASRWIPRQRSVSETNWHLGACPGGL